MAMTLNNGAMLPSANSAPEAITLIGIPGSRRVALFQTALHQFGRPPARIVAYRDLIAGHCDLASIVAPGGRVRIESPGKDFAVEQALLALGATIADRDGAGYEHISVAAAQSLPDEKGRIWPSRQWYLGYCQVLQQIAQHSRQWRWMNAPDDIALLFDKRRCHALLRQNSLAVPRALGPLHSHAELLTQMRQQGWQRVFVKLAHGSSASGVVAYRCSGNQQQAITTVEMVQVGGRLHLYNSRHMRVYREPEEIAILIDALCHQRVHVEEWIPKASFAGQTFDLRVMVIAGRVRQVVARMSHGPMTNLHLLNARGDTGAILAAIGAAQWEQARQTCERAARLLSSSLYVGIDLLFTPDFKRHAIVEMNAFGDLLPGVLDKGHDTYAAEIVAMQGDGLHPNVAPTFTSEEDGSCL